MKKWWKFNDSDQIFLRGIYHDYRSRDKGKDSE